ncbi:MAG: glycosyltransferase family 2 protein [Planctomycetia bacterium]|nr:glycosyltransferase family 2 protein [Planctomycetia bacterium]
MDKLELSIIAPAFNELGNIQPLVERIRDICVPLNLPFEAIIVDDGSTDGTREKLVELAKVYPWLRVVTLARNSGQTAAMDAGFRAARGKVWGTVDADMQNDPGEIPRLMAMLGPDVDMVNGWRKKRSDNALRRIQTRIANGIRNWISEESIQDSACSLKVYKRQCLEGLTLYKGMHRFFPTLVKMRGFKVIEVPVSHNPRLHGVTKYKFGSRVIRAFVDLLAVRWMKKRQLHYRATEITPLTSSGPPERQPPATSDRSYLNHTGA